MAKEILDKRFFFKKSIARLSVKLLGLLVPFWLGYSQVNSELALEQAFNLGRYSEIIDSLEQKISNQSLGQEQRATVHIYLAASYEKIGEYQKALAHLNEAVEIYRNSGQVLNLVAVLTDKAYLNLLMGKTEQVFALTSSVLQLGAELELELELELWLQIAEKAYRTRGKAFLLNQEYLLSFENYNESWQLAKTIGDSELIARVHLSLSEAHLEQRKAFLEDAQYSQEEGWLDEAKNYRDLADNELRKALAEVELASSLDNSSQPLLTVQIQHQLFELGSNRADKQATVDSLSLLPDSVQKAELMRQLAPFIPDADLLPRAIATSTQIKDNRGLALAYLAQSENQFLVENSQEALRLTRKAIANASVDLSFDILYRAWFTSAKINTLLGNFPEAKDDYRRAITNLQSLRSPSSDALIFQLDYRSEIEPVYRGYLELLLSNPVAENLQLAIQVFELMQLSDLESFFGDRCLESIEDNPEPVTVLSQTNSVAIYAISTQENLHVLMLKPTGEIKHHQIKISNSELEAKLKEWRYNLEDYATNRYLKTSWWLYDEMIRPLEMELEAIKPQTIVFLGDRFFRNVPLDALHDGEKFLLSKYPVAISLGLQFTDYRENENENREETLIFALTVEKPPFGELPYALIEAIEIANIVPDSQKFVDEQFTKNRLQVEVEEETDLSRLHLITHGNFAGSLENTYLQAFDETISLREFEDIVRQDGLSLDLIVLSACQTSTGNERSILGLVGISVRGSSQATVGSLWFVEDHATSKRNLFPEKFYLLAFISVILLELIYW